MKVLIVGGKSSGRAAARLLRKGGDEAVIYDTRPGPLGPLRDDGFRIHSGAWHPRLLTGVDLIVVSPGVPAGAAPVQDGLERGIPVWSEVELGYRRLSAPLVVVTGSRRAGQVAALLSSMLSRSGITAVAAGASSVEDDVLSSAVLAAAESGEEPDVVVAVVSGRGLRFVDSLRPRLVALLDIDPGDGAAAAIPNMFRNQGPGDVVVHEAAPGSASLAATSPARLVPVGAAALAAWPADVDGVPADDAVEVAVAATAAIELGADPIAVAEAIAARFDEPEVGIHEAAG